MKNLEIIRDTNQLGEQITHFARNGETPLVSYNHADREVAVYLQDGWMPLERYSEGVDELTVKLAIVKAFNSISAVNAHVGVEDEWDEFINLYQQV